jgi:RimJ/RimL family protein N-acetyltransferase
MLIRNAYLSDVGDIFEWRNDPFSQSMFVSTGSVTLKDHIDWYQRSLKNPLRKIYIGVSEDSKVGVVRFDLNINTNQSEVSINLNPKLRGKGYGFTLLSQSINLYRQHEETTLVASVKKENGASLKIFLKSNFWKVCEDELFYRLSRN